nr:MAG TPA: hypothetical protein [Caudoviricetes sp.]
MVVGTFFIFPPLKMLAHLQWNLKDREKRLQEVR